MMRQALDSVDAEAVIERLKRAAGVSSDTALSRALGLSHGAVHHWRKKGNIPVARVVGLLDKLPNVSIDWLLTGEGHAKETPLGLDQINAEQDRIDPDLLRVALKEAEDDRAKYKLSPPMPIHDCAPLIIRYLHRAERLVASLCASGQMTREQAIVALEGAAGLPRAPVTEQDHVERALRRRQFPTSYTRRESLKKLSRRVPEVISSGESDQSD